MTVKILSGSGSERAASRPWRASLLLGFEHGRMKESDEPLWMGDRMGARGKRGGEGNEAGRVPPIEIENEPECAE